MSYLEDYYNAYDEEGRLLSRHGQVEYLTTMKYIHKCLNDLSSPRILEVGAGTGRYSVTLAREGYPVTAVELIPHNLDQLKSKLNGTEPLTTIQGNALDLSGFQDDTFDLTMLLGPMYHLYREADKRQALSEAVRVTKPGGYILVSYCMNEPTVVQFVFAQNHLQEVLDKRMLTQDWHCISEEKDLFELIRPEEISELNRHFPVERVRLTATDGATNYFRSMIDAMDDKTFEKWMEYHFTICERQDLIGASHHTLDILRKKTCQDEIRFVEAEDHDFWFSLDRHLEEEAFLRKVRERQGYVMTVGGNPAGILRWSFFWDNIPFCNLIYVKEGLQRNGYGKRLMEHWERDRKAEGYGLVMTSTQSDEEAQHFYRALGYRDCGGLVLPFAGYEQPLEVFLAKSL